MRHGHGTTGNSVEDKKRREKQPQQDSAKEEKNRQRAQRGGEADELGITQGQNGEQGNSVKPGNTKESGKIRH